MTMAQPNAEAVQVRVDALPGCYQALLEALTLADFDAAALHEVFNRYVSAECLQCGIQITGDELGRIALVVPGDPAADAKIVRLRQGYCAQKDCESYYYRLVLNEHPRVDWHKLAASLGQIAPPPPTPLAPARATGTLSLWLADKRSRRLLAGVALVLVLLVIRHFVNGGTIPFIHQAPHYTVDPAPATPKPR